MKMKMKMKLLTYSLLISNAYSLSLSSGVSTLGAGIELQQNVTENISLKLNVNRLNVDLPFNNSQFNINLTSIGVLLDYKIWQNLAIQGGFYITNGGFEQQGSYAESYFNIKGYAKNHLKYDLTGTSPYVGLSYKSNQEKGFFIGGQLGTMLIKTTQTNNYEYGYSSAYSSLTATGYMKPTTNYSIYPVLGINLGYNF